MKACTNDIWMGAPERGFVLWFTGLPSSGKTTLAKTMADKLRDFGIKVELLDGDETLGPRIVGAIDPAGGAFADERGGLESAECAARVPGLHSSWYAWISSWAFSSNFRIDSSPSR